MKIHWAKLIFAAAVGIYFISLALTPETYRWIDAIDLIFHEAGHTLFGWLPMTVMFLGGSITQVAIPGIVVGSCWFKGCRYTAGLMLFWVGQSLMNVRSALFGAPLNFTACIFKFCGAKKLTTDVA